MNPLLPSFSFIIPALNEEKSIGSVVTEISSQTKICGIRDFEIIIVDDASTDATAQVAERLSSQYENIRLIRHDTRHGVGMSFINGAMAARKTYCLVVPADNEFDLEFFPEAIKLLEADSSCLIVTYAENPEIRSILRRMLSTMYLTFFNLLFWTDFKYTNGIVIFPSGWFQKLNLDSKGYTFQSEALLKACREGKRFAHVGMKLRLRMHGKSKVFSSKVFLDVLTTLIKIRIGMI